MVSGFFVVGIVRQHALKEAKFFKNLMPCESAGTNLFVEFDGLASTFRNDLCAGSPRQGVDFEIETTRVGSGKARAASLISKAIRI